MTDHTRQIERIEAAQTLDEIHDVAPAFPVRPLTEGGILYSGRVGNVPSEVIAKELAHKTGLPIINDTPRAKFLADRSVELAIKDSAQRILEQQGKPTSQAKKESVDFLFGDGKAAPESPLSIKNRAEMKKPDSGSMENTQPANTRGRRKCWLFSVVRNASMTRLFPMDARNIAMPSLPPPPVPQKLREMLKDYPEHIEELQQSLNRIIEKPMYGTPPFERAIWLLEGGLESFIAEARKELKAAEASGDTQAIANAKQKEFVMGSTMANAGGMPELWNYFQDHKKAFNK